MKKLLIVVLLLLIDLSHASDVKEQVISFDNFSKTRGEDLAKAIIFRLSDKLDIEKMETTRVDYYKSKLDELKDKTQDEKFKTLDQYLMDVCNAYVSFSQGKTAMEILISEFAAVAYNPDEGCVIS